MTRDARERPRRVVLLDVDGTLIDSNEGHARSWVATLAEAGIERSYEQVRALIGMGGDKLLPAICDITADSERGKALTTRRSKIFEREYLPAIRPFDGVDEFLDRLRADGHALIVATSAEKKELRSLLAVARLEWLLEDATSSSDADASKPDPDIIQAALKRADADASDAVMVGDTPYDIEAASRAGVPTIALRSDGWWRADDLADAAEQWESVRALMEAFEQSMLAGRVAAR